MKPFTPKRRQPKPKLHINDVPHWNVVDFVAFRPVIYRSLERANVGRIYSRAWTNLLRQRKPDRTTWAHLARHIGVVRTTPGNRNSVNGGISSRLYALVTTGRLPKDEAAKQKLFELAGYPWD